MPQKKYCLVLSYQDSQVVRVPEYVWAVAFTLKISLASANMMLRDRGGGELECASLLGQSRLMQWVLQLKMVLPN
jgi:hypothetical protein